MQVKLYMTNLELTRVIQQAMLIQEMTNDTIIELTIDDHRISVDVPNVVRSTQREVGINNEKDPHNLEVSGKD